MKLIGKFGKSTIRFMGHGFNSYVTNDQRVLNKMKMKSHEIDKYISMNKPISLSDSTFDSENPWDLS